LENTLPAVISHDIVLCMSLFFILWRNNGGKNYAMEYIAQDVN
jgi:hypothetical protein